jgi:type I restriction enzyme S subunit
MIEELKPYSDYQPVDSRWIPRAPSHWEVKKLRALTSPRSERNRPDLPLLSVARERGVFVRTDEDDNHNFVPDDLSNYKVARAGALVINKMKAWQGSMGIAPTDGIVSPAYFVYDLRVSNRMFGQALLRSRPYVAHFAQASDGVRVGQWDLSINRMREIPVLLPPPEEQDAIVRFLNHANRRIEYLAKSKRREMALLTEQKDVIVERAVTQGLQSSKTEVRRGLEWLGSTPTDWPVTRIKYLLREFDERSRSGSETLLSVRMHHGVVPFAEHFSRPPQAASLIGFKVVRPGQLVINRMQAGNGVIFPSRLHGLVSPDYAVFDPLGDVNVDFLGELFRCRTVRTKFRSESKGLGTGTSGFLRLYNDRLGAIHVALPNRSEQDRILEHLSLATRDIDRARSRLEREVALISEYRTRLIADVVTGLLDVRSAAAGLPTDGPTAMLTDLEGDEGIDIEDSEAA